jgi:uncharacterized protein (TIGR01777 family)
MLGAGQDFMMPTDISSSASSAAPWSILLTGGTGFVGSALVRSLLADGHAVHVLTRDAARVERLRRSLGNLVTMAATANSPRLSALERLDALPAATHFDAVVHLAGAPVIGPPWTRARRQQLIDSRVQTLERVRHFIERQAQRPRVLVSASAVGYYGLPRTGAVLTESSPPEPGRFQSDLCVAAEAAALRVEALGLRVVRLRPGIVLGHGGGAFPGLALSARLGLGAQIGSGTQPVPWIHLDDAVALIRHALADAALSGAVNAVAPERVTQARFVRATAAAWGRGVHLRLPAGLLRLALGEMAQLLTEGQAVAPDAALRAGFVFRWPQLDAALADLAQRR